LGETRTSARFEDSPQRGGRAKAPLHQKPAPVAVLQLAMRNGPSYSQFEKICANAPDTKLNTAHRVLSFAAKTAARGAGGAFGPADYVKDQDSDLYRADLDLVGMERRAEIVEQRQRMEDTFRTWATSTFNTFFGRLWRVRYPDKCVYTLHIEPVDPNSVVRRAGQFHVVLWDIHVPLPRQSALPDGCEPTFVEYTAAQLDPELDFGPYESLDLRRIRRNKRDNAVIATTMAYIDGGTNAEASARLDEPIHPPPTAEQIDAVLFRAKEEPEGFFFVGLDKKPVGYGSLWKCRPHDETALLQSLDDDGNVPNGTAVYGMKPDTYIAWVSSLRILPEHRQPSRYERRSGARAALAHSFERMLIAYAVAGVKFDHVWVQASHEHEQAYCRMISGKRLDDPPLPEPLKKFKNRVFRLQLHPWRIRVGKWTDLAKHYR
jgi:hypothetical protein